MTQIVIEGLVTKEIPILESGKIKNVKLGFFFGTLTFKLIKSNFDVDLSQIDTKIAEIKKDPIGGIDFIINFLYTSHEAWQMLNQAKPLVSKNQLWFSLDAMGPEEFAGILEEGFIQYADAGEKEEDKKKAT
jgi:hypothetical protein